MGDRCAVEGVGLIGWDPGSTVVVRQHRRGRFRAVTPMVVVEDGSDRTVLYVPRGTWFLAPADRTGRVTRSIADEAGTTRDRRRLHAALHIVPAGAGFSVMAMWRRSSDDFVGYYVNVQEPLRRTGIGFDSMDQTLDVLISPDRSHVVYKDEDELLDAAGHGFFSPAEVAEISASARAAVRMVVEGAPPFDEPWHLWLPDPAWPVPALPDDWADEPLSRSPWDPDVSRLAPGRGRP